MIYVLGILLIATVVFIILRFSPLREDEFEVENKKFKEEEEKRIRRRRMVASEIAFMRSQQALLMKSMEVKPLAADRITELRLEALETGKPLDPVALIEEALKLIPTTTGTTEARNLIALALKRLQADAAATE